MGGGGEVERLPEVIGGQAAVALRIWSAGDAATLREALQVSEEDFSDWLPGVLKDTADIGEFLQAARALFEEGDAYLYAITVGGKVVGQCSLHQSDGRHGVIGYWVRTDRAGQGFATEALGALTMAALARGYLRLELRCDEANGRSAAVARKAGYDHVDTVDVAGVRTRAQTGREMIWHRLAERA